MRIFGGIFLLLVFCTTILAKDYINLDKRGNYRGYERSDSSTIDRYDRHNRSDGWYSKDTDTTFNRRNEPRGFIIPLDRDDE
jgi:hypothetical protein